LGPVSPGLPPDEARAAALKSFGNQFRNTELGYHIRGGGWLETFWQDLRYGVRMLLKNPGFTATAVTSLALGIGISSIIFSLIDAALLRSLSVANPENLLRSPPAMITAVNRNALLLFRVKSPSCGIHVAGWASVGFGG
jgi:hypothetical protein